MDEKMFAFPNVKMVRCKTTTDLISKLSEILDTVDVPVLAAGGIGTGRAMAAALAAGADGVRIGTRLVAAQEAEAHPTYIDALIAARP